MLDDRVLDYAKCYIVKRKRHKKCKIADKYSFLKNCIQNYASGIWSEHDIR